MNKILNQITEHIDNYVEFEVNIKVNLNEQKDLLLFKKNFNKSIKEKIPEKKALKQIEETINLASEVTTKNLGDDYWDETDKFIFLTELCKLFILLGENSLAFDLVSKIEQPISKDRTLLSMSEAYLKSGQINQAFITTNLINRVSIINNAFYLMGYNIEFYEAHKLYPKIDLDNCKNTLVKGMSENINEQIEPSKAVTPYLYNYPDYTQNLSNILFHKAKIACFFEEERNEEKLDLLNEVLDIKEWRRISASA